MNNIFSHGWVRKARNGAAVFALMASAAIMAAPSAEATNLIVDGLFNQPTSPAPTTETGYAWGGDSVWLQNGGNNPVAGNACLMVGASAYSTAGYFCNDGTTNWPNVTISSTNPGTPPSGNAYADPLSSSLAITLSQTITGLTPGKQYTVSFDQAGFTLNYQATSLIGEDWLVSFGSSSQSSSTMSVDVTQMAAWTLQSLTFTAGAASQTLSFVTQLVGSGTPVSQFAALANVSVSQVQVPEPASIGIFGLAVTGILGLRRRRKTAAAV